ncbi:MAG: hypothetical protein EA416_17135 [Trueperaceae bacterium]|nr:MAG: hypothetical protein EA416_17135 [Trueperaceae bacterium]
MTPMLRFGFALVLAGALGACTSLIPDQNVSNAFGLDGVPVTATVGGAEATSLSGESEGSTQLSGTFASEVPRGDLTAIPGFISVASISDVITIQATVDVSAPGDVSFATSYTITGVAIELRVASGTATVIDQTWSAAGLELTFSGSATYDEGSDTTVGTYTVATEIPLVTLMVQGAAVDAFVDALSDGDTLDVAGALTVDLQPAIPSGAEVTLTLKSLGGTVTF